MHILSMMVVTSGSCDKFLKIHSHLPPYCTSSTGDISREVRRSKGWCKSSIKQENLRVGHKNLLNLSKKCFSPCVTGDYRKVSGLQSCSLLKTVPVISLGGKSKIGQGRKERFRIRSRGKENSGEMQDLKKRQRDTVEPYTTENVQRQLSEKDGKKNEVLGCGLKQTGPSDLPPKDAMLLDTGELSEQNKTRLFNRPSGGLLFDDIPSSELLKIQELKFSGDMWEGDSGPQVLDLQRALYWFGYLPKRTSLTAYFGPETKRALQQFQTSHGVLGTGVWGSSSRQALWKRLCAESSQPAEGGSNVHSNRQPVASLVENFSFQNLKAVGEIEVGVRVSELLDMMGAQSKEFISTVSSSPQWRHVPAYIPRNAGMVGLLFGVMLALFGLGYSVVGMFQGQPGQPVRRRVMKAHWRDDVTGGPATKTKRHLEMFPGLDLPLAGDEEFKYPSYRLRSKSKPSILEGTGRTDRLIMYEGQVIVGDATPSHVYPFRNGPTSVRGSGTSPQIRPKGRVPSLPVQASADQIPKKSANNGSISGQREEIYSGGQVPSKRMNNARLNGSRGEDQRNMKAESFGMAGSAKKNIKSQVPGPVPVEQSQEKQPNFVRNFLSALFTPRGLGQSAVMEKPSKKRSTSRSPQLDARSMDTEDGTESRPESQVFMTERSSKVDGHEWQNKDEVDLRNRVEELRKAVQATEQNRQAAMRALAEERQRSLELQVKISRQKEAAVALEEEVRVLKESHDALLASLRKKYSSSVAARAAAALLYQNWDTNHGEGSAQTVSY